MTFIQQIIIIMIVVLGTMLTRFLPFIIFPAYKTPPAFIKFLGKVLPNAVIGLLILYSLKDAVFSDFHCLPELIAIGCVVFLHQWKNNMLLSIVGGTILYMFLVQYCFI